MLEGIRGAFSKLVENIKTRSLSEKDIDRYVNEFKLQLVSNDVALEVAEKICEELSEKLRSMKFKRFGEVEEEVEKILEEILASMIHEVDVDDVLKKIEEKRKRGEPFIILFVGPNGSGKTTTIVKFAKYLESKGFKSLIAASDTFRAGAIEQLKRLAEPVGIRVVSQRYGADSAAVAMDAVMSAKANKIPVVLIDTAGRTEIDLNLLQEMNKIKRVVDPDLVIYVGDALAGNVAVEQAKRFDEHVGIDYAILAKLDADARGGSAISISYSINKPILFVGVGQDLDSLKPFTRKLIMDLILNKSS